MPVCFLCAVHTIYLDGFVCYFQNQSLKYLLMEKYRWLSLVKYLANGCWWTTSFSGVILNQRLKFKFAVISRNSTKLNIETTSSIWAIFSISDFAYHLENRLEVRLHFLCAISHFQSTYHGLIGTTKYKKSTHSFSLIEMCNSNIHLELQMSASSCTKKKMLVFVLNIIHWISPVIPGFC